MSEADWAWRLNRTRKGDAARAMGIRGGDARARVRCVGDDAKRKSESAAVVHFWQ